jgi:AraC family transcriptional regulator of adaptative response/methylated-DNA-[protein]-cysteine methyltransferase
MDRVFVYAVRSTGVYCLPSCPARRPGRDQVVFFDSPEAAERGGYRACRRCRPRERALNNDIAVLRRACQIIEAQATEPPSMAALAASSGIGRFRLQRLFRKLLGLSPRAYADAIRLRRLKDQLRKGDDVTTALYDAGYGSASRLYERSNAQLGMTPATYRRRGAGAEIGYTIAPSSAGRLLVAGTDRGLSAVYLGDRDTTLQATLRREFPEARIRRNSKQLSSWVRTIVRHLAGRLPHLELPLDVRATAFQRRVWDALQRIPYGKTRSYSEIARALGQPTAARAVARACATNPVSVVIPCHRVVREGGGLGGYRWGLARKQRLLDAERSASRSKSEG